METIGVSEFVREQVKRGGKSELLNISLEEVALAAEKKLNNGEFKNGYRDGVVIVEITDIHFCKTFMSNSKN